MLLFPAGPSSAALRQCIRRVAVSKKLTRPTSATNFIAIRPLCSIASSSNTNNYLPTFTSSLPSISALNVGLSQLSIQETNNNSAQQKCLRTLSSLATERSSQLSQKSRSVII